MCRERVGLESGTFHPHLPAGHEKTRTGSRRSQVTLSKVGGGSTHSQGGVHGDACPVGRGDPRLCTQPCPCPQHEHRAASSAAKKQPRAPKKPAVGSRAKPASAPKEPSSPVRKTKVPQGQGQQDSRPRSSAPRAPHRKVETEG